MTIDEARGGPTMTPEELDAIETRANTATPGPWEAERWGEYVSGPNGIVADVVDGTDEERAANLAFLSAVRVDVPTLVAEVRRLQTIYQHNQRKHT